MVYKTVKNTLFAVSVLLGTGIVLALALSFVPDASVELSTSERFLSYMHTLLTFDYSRPRTHDASMAALLLDRSINSFILIGGAVLIVGGGGTVLGIGSAMRPGSRVIGFFVQVSHTLSAIPVLVWALGLLSLSVMWFGIFPNFNFLENAGPWEALLIYSVPIASLGMGDGLLSEVVRNMENETRSELSKPYVRALRVRKASVFRHLLRGISSQFLYVITSKISYLVSGTIVVEVIFDVRGLAWLIYRSVAESPKEYTLVLAATMIFVGIVVFLNLISEIVALTADPRLRTQEEK